MGEIDLKTPPHPTQTLRAFRQLLVLARHVADPAGPGMLAIVWMVYLVEKSSNCLDKCVRMLKCTVVSVRFHWHFHLNLILRTY